MAKGSKPKRDDRDDDRVTVFVAAGFRHEGRYVRVGETIEMKTSDARDMAALYMVKILEPAK